MRIDAQTYARLPVHLQALFEKAPNPAKDEVLAGFPESGSPAPYVRTSGSASKSESTYGQFASRDGEINASFGDSGSAARFFYTAKADADDRCGSKHPPPVPRAR